ncbi:peptidoglycan-binding protein [Pedobacter gandavensis]|uniref:peptidoglycan-binding protein n=1 Tax=Pedobacter gandavensis TaxID=2679963 RepID=UPI002931142F|nr:peptidoglycan-binding protein [Pedobacter gandavensis]
MATNLFIMGFVCLTYISFPGYAFRPVLNENSSGRSQAEFRMKLCEEARKQLGVRERTGKNDGQQVELFLAVVGLKKGEPWCAAFISWLFHKMGRTKPKSGWSPDLFPKSKLTKAMLPGNLIGIYFPDKKRIAHVGMIEKARGSWIVAIEGNTNLKGSREGDGVYRKRRHLKSIHQISDWITEKRQLL